MTSLKSKMRTMMLLVESLPLLVEGDALLVEVEVLLVEEDVLLVEEEVLMDDALLVASRGHKTIVLLVVEVDEAPLMLLEGKALLLLGFRGHQTTPQVLVNEVLLMVEVAFPGRTSMTSTSGGNQHLLLRVHLDLLVWSLSVP